MKESDIEKRVCKYAEHRGFWVRKFVSPNVRGAPDHIMISPLGTVMFIEFKAEGGVLSARQHRELKAISSRGVRAHVVDSVQTGYELIDAIVRAEHVNP